MRNENERRLEKRAIVSTVLDAASYLGIATSELVAEMASGRLPAINRPHAPSSTTPILKPSKLFADAIKRGIIQRLGSYAWKPTRGDLKPF